MKVPGQGCQGEREPSKGGEGKFRSPWGNTGQSSLAETKGVMGRQEDTEEGGVRLRKARM